MAVVAATSTLWPLRLGVTPLMEPPEVLNEALTGALSIFFASFLTTSGRPDVSTVGA